MAIRLAVWFVLLASLPILVLVFFVRQNAQTAFVNLENNYHYKVAALLARQVALSDNLEDAQRLLATLERDEQIAFILSRNGTYLAHMDSSKINGMAENDFRPDTVRAILTQRDGFYAEPASFYFFAFTPVPGQEAVVVVAGKVSMISTVIGQLERESYLQLLASCLIAIGGSGAVIWLLIGLPVRKLTRAAEQISAGHLNTQVDSSDMVDDLAILGTTFNAMTNQVRELVENLEQRVNQRTAELTDANEKLERQNRQFQEANQKLAHEIAERQRTEAREGRQRQIAESLQQVALVLNSTLDQKQIVTTILGQLQAIMPYDGAAIWLIEGEELKIVEAAGLSLHRVGWSLPLDSDTPQTLVIHNRQPQIVADVTAEPRWPQWDVTEIIRSWMGTPLLAAQEAIGLLTLVRSDPGAFDLDDLQVLQSFANQAVTAISNARLYQQISTARERLSILYQASQVISAASLVPQQIYAGIHGAVARLMPADVFVVTLINEAEQEAEDVYLVDQGQVWPSQRYPLPGTFAHYLLRRGESLLTDDYSALPQEEFSFELFGSMKDTRSGLAVLLRGRERVLGLLSVQSYELTTYTDDDLELLELLAAHAAIALENTQLHQQAQTIAALEERNRLARDLHDSVTQSLYSLTLLAEGWRRLAQRGRLADLDGALTELGEIAQQSLKEMRLLIYELRPPALEQAGLLGALHQRLGAVERRAGIDARLIAAELIELPPQVEQGLYRITQEALNNALKHAKATAVTVFVRASGEWIEVEVTDNGCGFEPDRLNGQPGLGLISMRERAEQLGGELVVESQPGVGTTVQLKVSINS
ncbi:MAG: hypothetical protein BroJett011_74930 [Chloroflexota bacterium]|nr:MAG: hypothetical protein BroJett011_74930 [Chloroflexota bacterium]